MYLFDSKITFKNGLVTLILVILVPFVLFQAYSTYESYHRRYKEELKTNLEVAHATGKLFEQLVAGIVGQETAMGQSMSSSKSIEEMTSTFSKLRTQSKFIRNFSWVSPQGVVLASDMREAVGHDVRQKPYFSSIQNGSDWYISDLHPSMLTNQLIFSISKAVRSESGDLQAILVANINEEALDQELFFHRSRQAGICIIDRKGALVYSFPRVTLPWDQRTMLKAAPGIQDALAGKDYMGSNISPINGKELLVAYVPLSFGWVACASRTKEEAVAPIYDTLLIRLALFSAILSGAVILSLIISRRFSRSIGNLKEYADAVGRGDYHRNPRIFKISEFQFLAEAFGNMADQVKKREDALAKEQKVLDDIVRSTDVMLVSLDRDFNIIAFNPAYANACRKDPGEIVGKNHFDLFPRKEIQEIFERVRDMGITAYYKNTPFLNPSQPERGITYLDWSLSPIRVAGGLTGFSLAMRDTTQYNKDQDKLRLHARILESMTEGVVAINEKAIIIYTNTAEDVMFGYDPDELIGKHISILNDYLPEESQKIIGSVMDQLLSTGTWNGELRHRKKDTGIFYTHSYISRLNLNDRVFFVAVQIDITEEKRIRESLLETKRELRLANEQLEQKVLDRTKDLEETNLLLESAYQQLDRRAAKLRALANELTSLEQGVRKKIARVLHDNLQQILVATRLRIETLIGSDRSELQGEMAELADLLKQAIEITRSITTELSLPALRAGLPNALRWLVKWMKKQHNLDVDLKVEEGIPPVPEEIKFFLFEAARELLFNTVKHAGVDRATVVLQKKERESIHMSVSDQGTGFDPEKMKTSTEYNGFGLFSVMERIQLFEGTLDIYSSPGKGSVFALTIPLPGGKEVSPGQLLEEELPGATPDKKAWLIQES